VTARVLPPAEWPRLTGTELEAVWPTLNPETARVMVVEEGDRIVGCWAIFPVFHVECVWIAPSHRGRAGVARSLIRLMRLLARLAGARVVMTAAVTPQVERLITQLRGVPVPPHFVIPVGE
jgi:hypothetical protein